MLRSIEDCDSKRTDRRRYSLGKGWVSERKLLTKMTLTGKEENKGWYAKIKGEKEGLDRRNEMKLFLKWGYVKKK